MAKYTKEQAKLIVQRGGSNVTEKDNVPYVTTVDKEDTFSSWLVVPSTMPKIDYEQVTKAIDLEVSELKPNIPTTTIDFVSREQYNLLLSQSVELNSTIDTLRTQTQELSTRISDLESQTDEEITNRLSIQQTNILLVNQLTALSKTIDGFGQQISTALQKSVEESIFRTSLQAQNKGYEAQIQALITQADSLNAIITGLYAQLGAAVVQADVENQAQSLAASEQGFNINEVVVVKQLPDTQTRDDGKIVDFLFKIRNKNPDTWYKWTHGGNLTFNNVNKVPVKVTINVYYPRADGATGAEIKFFKYTETSFTLSANQSGKLIKAIYNYNDPELQKKLDGPCNPGSHSKRYRNGSIKITVKNESTGVTKSETYVLDLDIVHKNSY